MTFNSLLEADETLIKEKTYKVKIGKDYTYSIYKGIEDNYYVSFTNICSVDKRRSFKNGYWMLNKHSLNKMEVFEDDNSRSTTRAQ